MVLNNNICKYESDLPSNNAMLGMYHPYISNLSAQSATLSNLDICISLSTIVAEASCSYSTSSSYDEVFSILFYCNSTSNEEGCDVNLLIFWARSFAFLMASCASDWKEFETALLISVDFCFWSSVILGISASLASFSMASLVTSGNGSL